MRIIIGNWKGNLEIVIVIVILVIVIVSHVGCSCSKLKGTDVYSMFNDVKEGFANIGAFAPVNQPPPNPKKWEQPSLTIAQDTPLPQGVIDVVRRKGMPLASEPNTLTMEFKPECCPSTFSNSTGCGCLTLGQYKYLKERGGNHTTPDTI